MAETSKEERRLEGGNPVKNREHHLRCLKEERIPELCHECTALPRDVETTPVPRRGGRKRRGGMGKRKWGRPRKSRTQYTTFSPSLCGSPAKPSRKSSTRWGTRERKGMPKLRDRQQAALINARRDIRQGIVSTEKALEKKKGGGKRNRWKTGKGHPE